VSGKFGKEKVFLFLFFLDFTFIFVLDP